MQLHVGLQNCTVIIFRMRHSRGKIYIVTAVCVSVCVCVSVPLLIPTLLHGPGCNLGEW